jgi:hypothetical protein
MSFQLSNSWKLDRKNVHFWCTFYFSHNLLISRKPKNNYVNSSLLVNLLFRISKIYLALQTPGNWAPIDGKTTLNPPLLHRHFIHSVASGVESRTRPHRNQEVDVGKADLRQSTRTKISSGVLNDMGLWWFMMLRRLFGLSSVICFCKIRKECLILFHKIGGSGIHLLSCKATDPPTLRPFYIHPCCSLFVSLDPKFSCCGVSRAFPTGDFKPAKNEARRWASQYS